MKKIIINFGIENISVLRVEYKGKTCSVLNSHLIPANKLYNSNGTFDMKKVISKIKELLDKDELGLDVDIVLPSYMTRYEYFESDKKNREPESKESYIGKLTDRIKLNVGSNSHYKIDQVIYYSKKSVKAIQKELYNHNINVVSIVPSISAFQYSMPFYISDSEYSGVSTNHLMVDIGLNQISCIIYEGNLPIYVKESGYSLYELYSNIKDRFTSLTFNQFMSVYNSMSKYDDIVINDNVLNVDRSEVAIRAAIQRDQEKLQGAMFDDDLYDMKNESTDVSGADAENSESVNLDSGTKQYIKNEINNLFDILCREIREVIDFAKNQYGAQSIDICCNDEKAHSYIAGQLSEIFSIRDYISLDEQYNFSNLTIDLSRAQQKTMEIIGCLGDITCSMKKGAEFYE